MIMAPGTRPLEKSCSELANRHLSAKSNDTQDNQTVEEVGGIWRQGGTSSNEIGRVIARQGTVRTPATSCGSGPGNERKRTCNYSRQGKKSLLLSGSCKHGKARAPPCNAVLAPCGGMANGKGAEVQKS